MREKLLSAGDAAIRAEFEFALALQTDGHFAEALAAAVRSLQVERQIDIEMVLHRRHPGFQLVEQLLQALGERDAAVELGLNAEQVLRRQGLLELSFGGNRGARSAVSEGQVSGSEELRQTINGILSKNGLPRTDSRKV